MKIDLKQEELDLVINALNFVFESKDCDVSIDAETVLWLKPWLKELSDQSEQAGDLLDKISDELGLS